MYMIAGLGNPGKKYEATRHNMGFDCVSVICERLGIRLKHSRFNARVGKCGYNGSELLIVKPYTYMNASGDAISGIAGYYKIDIKNELLVIYDDTDLDIGTIRLRKKGSAGSHNGMKSVVARLKSPEFQRIRIGIGKRPAETDMISFVLGRFPKAERPLIDAAVERAADAALDAAVYGFDHAMNNYN